MLFMTLHDELIFYTTVWPITTRQLRGLICHSSAASLVPGSTQRLRPPLSLRTSRLVIFFPEVCPTVWLIKLGAFAQMCGNKPDGHAEHRAVKRGLWVWTEMVEGRQTAGMMKCMPLNSVVWVRYREWKQPEKDEMHIQYACGREAPC